MFVPDIFFGSQREIQSFWAMQRRERDARAFGAVEHYMPSRQGDKNNRALGCEDWETTFPEVKNGMGI